MKRKVKRRKHKVTIRTGLPQATWRKLNEGSPYPDSITATKPTSIDTLIQLHQYLSTIPNPSKEITASIKILESRILSTIKTMRKA